jgi:epoxyqueuosine reductase
MLTEIISKAYDLGFISIGFSPLERPLFIDEFKSWIGAGKNAGMSWLEKNIDVREDPSKLLDQCKTIISLAYPYPSKKPATNDGFTVSRYSRPDQEDYHKTMKDLCAELVTFIKSLYRDSSARICVDSVPVMERSFGYSSGIGFIGKNNMLIIPEYGSYFFLAEILTTAQLNISDPEVIDNQCGDCSLCVDSCPTGALESPFCLDPSRCLSYLTIECKKSPDKLWGRYMGDCFVGCDICQEVCPFNKEEKRRNICLPSTDELLSMSNGGFNKLFGKTALSRPGLQKIKENIKILKE